MQSAITKIYKQLFDWRWESLGHLLDEMVPIIPILVKFWNLARMRGGSEIDGLSAIDAASLGICDLFLHTRWLLPSLDCSGSSVTQSTGGVRGWKVVLVTSTSGMQLDLGLPGSSSSRRQQAWTLARPRLVDVVLLFPVRFRTYFCRFRLSHGDRSVF